MAQKLPKMVQKLAPAKKNSRDISPVSPTFCISVLWTAAGLRGHISVFTGGCKIRVSLWSRAGSRNHTITCGSDFKEAWAHYGLEASIVGFVSREIIWLRSSPTARTFFYNTAFPLHRLCETSYNSEWICMKSLISRAKPDWPTLLRTILWSVDEIYIVHLYNSSWALINDHL